MKQWPDKQDT